MAWLRGHGIRCLPVCYREAMGLGCNVPSLGRGWVVVSAAASRGLHSALRADARR